MNIYQRDHTQVPALFTWIREHKNEEAIKHCLRHPEEINLKGWMNSTPLHIAAEAGNFEMTAWLVKNGANVNSPRSGVYRMAVGWACTAETAELLLENGARLDGEELMLPTAQNHIAVVNALLRFNSPISAESPQYLRARSKEMLDVYVKHQVPIDGCDKNGSTLLHRSAWNDHPELFDYAFRLGVEWRKDNSNRTPYALAKQGRRTTMIEHLKKNYTQYTDYAASPLQTDAYNPERITWMRRVSRHDHLFVALTLDGELLQFRLAGEELQLIKGVSLNVLPIRNYTIDQSGNLVIPTGDNELLLVNPHKLEISNHIQLDAQAVYDQITYLPGHEVFLASGNEWAVHWLDAGFRELSKQSVDDGILFPVVDQSEELLSLYSYDQECYHTIYATDEEGQLKNIQTFDGESTTGYDLAIDGNEVFVVSVPFVRAYRFKNRTLELSWEKSFAGSWEKIKYGALALLSKHVMVLGCGEAIYLLSRRSGELISQPRVSVSGKIKELIADAPSGKLIIRTNKALHVAGIGRLPG